MKYTLTLILTILASTYGKAQFIKERTVDITIGFGVSAPYEDVEVADSGFYLQGEYVLILTKWVDLRPYAGIILIKFDGLDLDGNPTIYKSTSKALLMGGKTRLTAPIPWVAPYFEIGIGASIGSFETLTPYNDIDKKGLIIHIPFSLGLELGPKHNFDIAFTFYSQPNVRQLVGAAAFGVSIPLNKKS